VKASGMAPETVIVRVSAILRLKRQFEKTAANAGDGGGAFPEMMRVLLPLLAGRLRRAL